ncbi:MAG: hypothetical protein HY064_09360 [Bacteroidetes bacterium]|nr:hypothetical protein [Bacteroidota bacterium]
MKYFYLTLFILPFSLHSQTSVTNSPSAAVTSPSSACLACPGEIWNNETNVFSANNMFASVNLTANGNCFQSTCYASRFLYASAFGFSIPAAATIDSIIVDILRVTNSPASARDSIVQLTDGVSMLGADLHSTTLWATTATTATYGHSDPLWSYAFTPATINAVNFGTMLKVMNISPMTTNAGVDHIQMTVYYSTTTGIHSATAAPSSVTWINNNENISAKIHLDKNVQCTSNLYDAEGRLLNSKDLGLLPAGDYEIVPQEYFPAREILFWEIIPGDEIFSEEFVTPQN